MHQSIQNNFGYPKKKNQHHLEIHQWLQTHKCDGFFFLIRFPPTAFNPIEIFFNKLIENFLKISAPFQSLDTKLCLSSCFPLCLHTGDTISVLVFIQYFLIWLFLCSIVVRFLVRFFSCMVQDDDHVTDVRFGFVAQFGIYDVICDSDVLLRVFIRFIKGNK